MNKTTEIKINENTVLVNCTNREIELEYGGYLIKLTERQMEDGTWISGKSQIFNPEGHLKVQYEYSNGERDREITYLKGAVKRYQLNDEKNCRRY